MYVYKVFQGKLHIVEVKKETKEFYYLETRELVFGCCARILKSEASTSPEQAINDELSRLNKSLSRYEAMVMRTNTEINEVKSLLDLYSNQNISEL